MIGLLAVLVLSSVLIGVGPSSGPSMASRSTIGVSTMGVVPSSSEANLTVTVHNTMANATGNYQQPIEIDSLALSSWINSNWTNGRVYDATSGAPLYAWIESGASNSSNDTLLWVKMASIPAGGWSNLTISFGPLGSFDLSAAGLMGEAPGLSSTYGAFDNGANVFNFYDDFAGTQLSSSWSVDGNWNYSVDNGFSVNSVPGMGGAVVSLAHFDYPAVLDFYGDMYQLASTSVYIDEGLGTAGCVACGNAAAVSWGQGTPSSGVGPAPFTASGSSIDGGTSVSPTQVYDVFTTEAVNSSVAQFEANYRSPQVLVQDIPSSPLPVRLAGSGYPSGALTSTETTYWVRERTYEPQMPTVKVSGVPESAVTFAASGLSWGTSWTVTLGHTTATSTGPISFLKANGTYSYTIGAIAGYNAIPSSGSVTVAGVAQSVSIRFSASSSTPYYAVDFTESGLASGSTWAVNLSGTTQSATSSTIGFSETNGSYSYSVSCGSNYTASPASGTATVSGSIVALSVVCQNATGGFAPTRKVNFDAAGLPNTLEWTVVLTPQSSGETILVTLSVTRTAVGNQPITFTANEGTYSYSAAAPGYGAQAGMVNIGTAPTAQVSLNFVPAPSRTPGPSPGPSTTPSPLVNTEFWVIGLAIAAIGAVGLGATVYRARALRAEQGRDLVRGITEIEWSSDGSGEPTPRMNR